MFVNEKLGNLKDVKDLKIIVEKLLCGVSNTIKATIMKRG